MKPKKGKQSICDTCTEVCKATHGREECCLYKPKKGKGRCEWKVRNFFKDDDVSDTSCGYSHVEGMSKSTFKFCPYCGKPIKKGV